MKLLSILALIRWKINAVSYRNFEVVNVLGA